MQYFSAFCDGADGEQRDCNASDGAECEEKIEEDEEDEGWGEAEEEATAGTANDDEDGNGYDNEIGGIDGCRGDAAVFLRDCRSLNHMGLHDSMFSPDWTFSHDRNNSQGEKIFHSLKPKASSDAAFEAYLTFIDGPEPVMKRSRVLQYPFPLFEVCSPRELAERRLRNILRCMDSAAAGCSDADDMEAKRLLICGRCRCEEVKNFRRRFIQAACRDGIALKYIADFLSVSHETVRRRVPGTSTKIFISLL